jgi:hypothetical protein
MKGIHKITKVLLRLQICKMHTFSQKFSQFFVKRWKEAHGRYMYVCDHEIIRRIIGIYKINPPN